MLRTKKKKREVHKEPADPGQKSQAYDLPAKTALYFYPIMVFGLILPAILACCLVFAGIGIDIAVALMALAFVGGVACAYRKINKQLQALQSAIEHLNSIDEDYEIALPGGLITLRVEQKTAGLSPPASTSHEEDASRIANTQIATRKTLDIPATPTAAVH